MLTPSSKFGERNLYANHMLRTIREKFHNDVAAFEVYLNLLISLAFN